MDKIYGVVGAPFFCVVCGRVESEGAKGEGLAGAYVGLGCVYQYINKRSTSVYYLISGIYPENAFSC